MSTASRHSAVWAVFDEIATEQATSPSGLAKRAGRNSTTFNPSKRVRDTGKERFPTLAIIFDVIDIAGISLEEFGRRVDEKVRQL